MVKISIKNKFILFIVKGALGTVIVFIAIAVVGQIHVALHPGYSNIVLEPDPVLGWRFAPEIEFINTGNHWYANELSVKHKTNALGFLGPMIPKQKPADTARIALMGDSFVEALQVPLKHSAVRVLETKLNQLADQGKMLFRHYEVQNFGISNLSVGQYLLIWEHIASEYSPDYLFIYVAGEQLRRTDDKVADWGISISRPSFEIVNGELIRHPVVDYEKASKAFDDEIEKKRGRFHKRKQRIFIIDWVKGGDMMRMVKNLIPSKIRLSLKQLVTDNAIQPFWPALKDKFLGRKNENLVVNVEKPKTSAPALEITQHELDVNLRVMKELDRKVNLSGAELIVVDASLYYWFMGANETLPNRLKDFCLRNDIPYIPLYKALLETDRNNLWARFQHSHHFNEHGNALFASNMLEWIKNDVKGKLN